MTPQHGSADLVREYWCRPVWSWVFLQGEKSAAWGRWIGNRSRMWYVSALLGVFEMGKVGVIHLLGAGPWVLGSWSKVCSSKSVKLEMKIWIVRESLGRYDGANLYWHVIAECYIEYFFQHLFGKGTKDWNDLSFWSGSTLVADLIVREHHSQLERNVKIFQLDVVSWATNATGPTFYWPSPPKRLRWHLGTLQSFGGNDHDPPIDPDIIQCFGRFCAT